MKYLFLDIDGVLNSYKYDKERDIMTTNNIDGTRLDLVKEIVDKTGAKIILTSTWRKHWEKSETFCDEVGKDLNATFKAHGLEIYDKTPNIDFLDRAVEVEAYLSDKKDDLEAFCIVDDMMYAWDNLSPFFVKTNPRVGYGLMPNHVEKIIKLLNPKKGITY